MNKKNLRVVSLIFSFVFTVASAQAQGPGGPPSGIGDQSLAAKIAALEARVAKLEGQITASDLAGTYAFHGFQTELRAKSQDGFTAVSSYVFQGTVVLAADGTGTLSEGTELGHALALFIGTPTFIPPSRTLWNKAGGGLNLTWSYANGAVTGFGFPLSVTAGGRVLVATGSNPADGTTTILILTRLQ